MSGTKRSYTLCWASDFSDSGGEGVLSRHFASSLSKASNTTLIVVSPESIYSVNEFSIRVRKSFKLYDHQDSVSKFTQTFIRFLQALVFKWKTRSRCSNFIYLNYVPLWNIFIFLLFRGKNIQLGPVVGGEFSFNSRISIFQNIVRVILFPFLYKISCFLCGETANIISANSTIDMILKKNGVVPFISCYNTFFLESQDWEVVRKNREKSIDFIFYNRNHPAKYPNESVRIINLLTAEGFQVVSFGEINHDIFSKQLGYIDRRALSDLFSKSHYFVNLADNYENLTVMDAVSKNCKVINIKGKPSRRLGIRVIPLGDSFLSELQATFDKKSVGNDLSHAVHINKIKFEKLVDFFN